MEEISPCDPVRGDLIVDGAPYAGRGANGFKKSSSSGPIATLVLAVIPRVIELVHSDRSYTVNLYLPELFEET